MTEPDREKLRARIQQHLEQKGRGVWQSKDAPEFIDALLDALDAAERLVKQAHTIIGQQHATDKFNGVDRARDAAWLARASALLGEKRP